MFLVKEFPFFLRDILFYLGTGYYCFFGCFGGLSSGLGQNFRIQLNKPCYSRKERKSSWQVSLIHDTKEPVMIHIFVIK